MQLLANDPLLFPSRDLFRRVLLDEGTRGDGKVSVGVHGAELGNPYCHHAVGIALRRLPVRHRPCQVAVQPKDICIREVAGIGIAVVGDPG
jgi:hypothetical protein